MRGREARAMRNGWVLALLLASCAAPQKTASKSEAPPAKASPKRTKLTVLAVESDTFPRLASGLTGLMRAVEAKGIDDYSKPKVTLEVVQLSIECLEASNECWSAVGRTLASDRLLLAQIARGPKKKDRSMKVTVTYFDVVSGQPIHVGER